MAAQRGSQDHPAWRCHRWPLAGLAEPIYCCLRSLFATGALAVIRYAKIRYMISRELLSVPLPAANSARSFLDDFCPFVG